MQFDRGQIGEQLHAQLLAARTS
eukprot:SAG11_NODE_52831_length_105_cov_90.166667_1_plen_22_part_01